MFTENKESYDNREPENSREWHKLCYEIVISRNGYLDVTELARNNRIYSIFRELIISLEKKETLFIRTFLLKYKITNKDLKQLMIINQDIAKTIEFATELQDTNLVEYLLKEKVNSTASNYILNEIISWKNEIKAIEIPTPSWFDNE